MKAFPTASFSVVQGSYTLTDSATGVSLGAAASGSTWSVTAAGTTMLVQGPGGNNTQPFQGPITLTAIGGAGGNHPNLFNYNGIQYRGSLVIQILNSQLLVLNVLDVESYLTVWWARRWAAAPRLRHTAPRRWPRAPMPSPCAASLPGMMSAAIPAPRHMAATPRSRILPATGTTRWWMQSSTPAAQVLKYAGALVKAYFHSNAGGYTEDAENVWGISEPYLKGVPSAGDAYADTLGGWAQTTYSWTKTFDRSDLGAQLGVGRILDIQVSCNRTQVSTDPVTGSTTVNFLPGTTTVSGRVTQLTVIGANGSETYTRDDIRQALGLESTLFDVDVGGQLEGLDAQGQTEAITGDEVCVEGKDGTQQSVPLGSGSLYIIGSGNRLVTQSASSEEITFNGRGDGHGVGMSQWGAIGMAAQGDNYQAILELYYDQGKNDGNLQIVGNYGSTSS